MDNCDYSNMLDDICDIAKQAGLIEKEVFEKGFTAEYKKDGSPVTIADKKAEELIIRELEKLDSKIPFVGEEFISEGNKVDISDGLYWLVDPLDGTKEFINQGKEFTVNIALMENFQPILGVIYTPMFGDIYASAGKKAFMQKSMHAEKIPIYTRKPPKEGLTVVTGRRHGKPPSMNKFVQKYKSGKVNNIIECSSSLKMCMIASGLADVYPRLGPTSEWDTGAADAILRASGGHILQLSGKPIVYGNIEKKFENPHFIASSSALELTEVFS